MAAGGLLWGFRRVRVIPASFWALTISAQFLVEYPSFLSSPKQTLAFLQPERGATMLRRLLRRLSTTAEGAVTASPSSSPSQSQSVPDGLYRRIMDVGRPNAPLSPVLEQWAREGHTIKKHTVQAIVKKLVGLRRFANALEVLGKSSFPLNPTPREIDFFLD